MTYLFTGNATITNEVEVKNDSGNALPVVGVTGSPLTVSFGGATVDAFGRLRVSQPHTIFDSSFSRDDNPVVWDTIKGGSGNTNYSSNITAVVMSVGTASGDYVVRQTKPYFKYQPGKSLFTLNTFVMGAPKANLRQRVGYFNQSDGIFLERTGNVNYIVKRSSTNGLLTDTKVPQSDWNGDKLDGQGASKKYLSTANAQIFFTDIEWLGVGSVRTGFVIDGEYAICHSFHHANTASNVYMTTATLPVRYEIENIGATSSDSALNHICNTVISEAGYAPTVTSRSAATDLTGLSMSQTEFRPILALRLKSDSYKHVVIPQTLNLYGLQSTPFVFKIMAAATISGGLWQSTDSLSAVEYNSNATSIVTTGYELMQGMFIGGTSAQPVTINLKERGLSMQLRSNIAGYSEIFLVAAKATTNNDDALGSITWEEFT